MWWNQPMFLWFRECMALHVLKTLLIPWPLAFQSFCSLSVMFPKYLLSYFLHMDQCKFVLTPICYVKNLLWWSLRVKLDCGYKKYLEDNVILSPFSNIAVLRPITYLAKSSSLSFQYYPLIFSFRARPEVGQA